MKKVERIVNTTTKGGTQPPVQLSTFLKAHMLGLISHINDMLQDVQGKKSVASKRKIIRGLGALILQIGPTITHAAPQVRDQCISAHAQPLKSELLRLWPRSKQ